MRSDEWLRHVLVCPLDHAKVSEQEGSFVCEQGHSFPIVDGIAIMLDPEQSPTLRNAFATTQRLISERHSAHGNEFNAKTSLGIDDYVQANVAGSCGNLYKSMRGKLTRYPIPDLPLDPSRGTTFLDVGSNWGRWTISAASKGYISVGVEPNLRAVLAARRVANQLGMDASFVVGDARCLPFRTEAFDVTFSYSVLQHFEKGGARLAVREMARCTGHGGLVLVQLPNKYGFRQTMNRWLNREHRNQFRVRWWTLNEMESVFSNIVGPTTLEADGYFSINAQASDLDLLPLRYRAVVRVSELLKRASTNYRTLIKAADSIFVRATKPE